MLAEPYPCRTASLPASAYAINPPTTPPHPTPPPCSFPCTLCARELARFDLQVHCTLPDGGWFEGRVTDPDAPAPTLTSGQLRQLNLWRPASTPTPPTPPAVPPKRACVQRKSRKKKPKQ